MLEKLNCIFLGYFNSVTDFLKARDKLKLLIEETNCCGSLHFEILIVQKWRLPLITLFLLTVNYLLIVEMMEN